MKPGELWPNSQLVLTSTSNFVNKRVTSSPSLGFCDGDDGLENTFAREPKLRDFWRRWEMPVIPLSLEPFLLSSRTGVQSSERRFINAEVNTGNQLGR